MAQTIDRLVRGLRERGQYRIQLIRPRHSADDNEVQSEEFEEHLLYGWRLPFYAEVRVGLPQYFKLRRLWLANRPDIVQVVTEGPLGYAAVKAAKNLGIPVISDFHTHFDQYSQYYNFGRITGFAKLYLRSLHNQTLVTLVPTRTLCESLLAEGYNRLGLLQRGIDTELFNPGRRSKQLRRQLGVEEDQLLVAIVTRVAKEKNLQLAFNAYRAIQNAIPDACFLLVGDGPVRKELQSQNPDCRFVGMKTGIELAEHYASADLFLYPSKSETYGNVIIEAMASGLPVVAFDYAAAGWYIDKGDNGVTVPLSADESFIQSAVDLAKDKCTRHRMGQSAALSVQRLNWERVVEQLHQIIQSVLQEVCDETDTSTKCSRDSAVSGNKPIQ